MDTGATKPWLFFDLVLVLSCCLACFSIAGNTLSSGQSLSASKREIIASPGGNFELGFFIRGTPSRIYLGIWYKRFEGEDVVWVANRENHLSDPSSSRLQFSDDGNLVLLESRSNSPFWSTDLTYRLSNSTEAVLRDDGNFVLIDKSNPSSILWESFDHPTDTWLPGAKLGIDKITGKPKQFISWKNSEDPAPGMFSLSLDPNGREQFVLEWNKSHVYWSSGLWNGKYFSSILENTSTFALKFSFVSNENEKYFNYSLYHMEINISSKYVIEFSGQIQQQVWEDSRWVWNLYWSEPRQLADVYSFCGAFGVYNDDLSNACECLEGFKPFSIEYTKLNDFSGGCVRKSPLQCENRTYAYGKNDGFLKMPNMRLPVNSEAHPAASARACEVACMNICSCTAYAYNSNGCMIWEGALLNLQQLSDRGGAGQDIYIRLAFNELQSRKGNKWIVWVIAAVLTPALGLLIGCLCICFSSRRNLKRKGEEASSNDLLLFDFNTELHAISDGINTGGNSRQRGKNEFDLPLFSYESVSAATNNFSAANKLGEGGFGPVYKGELLRGQEIAVKMLSRRSGQGGEEFKNEILLIAKLQHRNLVRLLGCCIEGDEKLLIYEYMPNKSLDYYLFDPIKAKMLDWETRKHIIEGIAQGLLYLHQYSRLRIIHRDLKPSNILLDSEMNPKISDFGMARIVGDTETQANTNRVVGTYGYMSPEYAMEGLYSIKSDVFSFGVLLLEIVSGKRNTGFYNSKSLNLLRYAWELWMDDRIVELIDQTIGYSSPTSILLRFINIGLLCVQESPTERPTMSEAVSMIINEHAPLTTPKQPAFVRGRNMLAANPATNSAGDGSVYGLTVSIMEPR